MATAAFLPDGEPWQDITHHLRKPRTSAALCAISYIGVNAPSHLPLKAGDTLVCNASDRAISSGATSPTALLHYLHTGVRVFNDKTLHAKVLIVGTNTWIGSANASDNSAGLLAEAAVRTSDAAVRQAARQFIIHCQEQELDVKSVSAMLPKVTKSTHRSGPEAFDEWQPREPLRLPVGDAALWMMSVEWGDWPQEVADIYLQELPAEKARVRRSPRRASIDVGYLIGPHSLKVGDWVSDYDDTHAHTPAQLFDITTHDDITLTWSFKPPGSRSRVALGKIEKALPAAAFAESPEWDVKLTPKQAAAVFDLFRLPGK